MTTTQDVLNEISRLRNHSTRLNEIQRALTQQHAPDGRRQVTIAGLPILLPVDKLLRIVSDETASTVMRLQTLEKHMKTIDELLNQKMGLTP